MNIDLTAVVGLITAISTVVLGWRIWLSTQEKDEAAKEAATESGVLVFLGKIQEDNNTLRGRIGNLETRLTAVEATSSEKDRKVKEAERKVEIAERKVTEMQTEINELKSENETLKSRVRHLEEANGSRKEVP